MYPRKLVPDSYEVPMRVEFEGLLLTPVTFRHWPQDVRAVHSVAKNSGALNPGLKWPEGAESVVLGMSDVCYMDKLLRLRAAFCYGLMTPDESVELGCLYVWRTRKRGYEAEIFSWVCDEPRKQGIGERLYQFAEKWVPEAWPFDKTTWPGRRVPWQDWYALPDKDPANWPGSPPSFALVPHRIVPDSFRVPHRIEAKRFILVPLLLTMDAVAKDFEAFMSSQEYLKTTFRPGEGWPEGTTFQDALVDVGYWEFLWHFRESFAYSVRDPEDNYELGCLYVTPSRKAGYQAEVHSWVRESAVVTGLDEEVNEFSHTWIQEQWPFEKVAWPGRDIGWDQWRETPDYDPEPV